MNNKFLTQVITAGKKIVKYNPVLPILDNVCFYENHFTMSSLETTLICYHKTGLNGCVDTAQFIKALTIDPDISQDKETAIFRNGKKEIKIKISDNSDFPVMDPGASLVSVFVKTKEILKAETFTIKDTFRLWMPAVYIGNKYSSKIEVVATDAHKIYKYNTGFSTENKFQALLSPETLSLLKSLNTDSFYLDVSKQWLKLSFAFNGAMFEIIQKNIDTAYPNYNAVIPDDTGTLITYERKTLIKALKECLPFANRVTKNVALGDALKAHDVDFDTEYKEELKYTGGVYERHYNGQFLIDSFNLLSGDQVTLNVNSRSTLINEGEETILIMQLLNSY